MTPNRIPTALLALTCSLAAGACGFDQHTQLVAPTAPSAPAAPTAPTPPGGSGSLTGTWASESPLAVPASWSCGNVQWNITSQTPTSLSGSFSALCSGVVVVSGVASGQLNGEEVALQADGTATVEGVITCPFSLTGTGHIEGNSAIRIPYTGTTCLGPVHGEETLRRPAPDTPAPPPPPPPAPPPDSSHHVPPGPLDVDRAYQVVHATADEFPNLTAPHPTRGEAESAAEELLLRIIWHLQLAGYDAGRQRNPSGAISNDKLDIFIGGAWHAYDLFRDYGAPNTPMDIIFFEVFPPSPISYPGIPD